MTSSWKEESLEEGDNIREAPRRVNKDWIPEINEQCECKAKSEENEPYGWWNIRVKSLSKQGNSIDVLFQFDEWPAEHDNGLELKFLRPRNSGSLVSSKFSLKNVIENVINLPEYASKFIKDDTSLDDIRKLLISLYYRENERQLVLIGENESVEKASSWVCSCLDQEKMVMDDLSLCFLTVKECQKLRVHDKVDIR